VCARRPRSEHTPETAATAKHRQGRVEHYCLVELSGPNSIPRATGDEQEQRRDGVQHSQSCTSNSCAIDAIRTSGPYRDHTTGDRHQSKGDPAHGNEPAQKTETQCNRTQPSRDSRSIFRRQPIRCTHRCLPAALPRSSEFPTSMDDFLGQSEMHQNEHTPALSHPSKTKREFRTQFDRARAAEKPKGRGGSPACSRLHSSLGYRTPAQVLHDHHNTAAAA
jgi:hypothetical protein